ncbi:MAG TPA: DUF1731 domain-containing protein, partial [Pyrinomonadaceae bacterium]|nr:DUF1731 domain-containing protein [Pyrinomonadaceae bacterium]
ELRCALKRPWSPRVPAWLVRLGSLLMRTEADLALTGRRCIPDRLVESGFKFIYTNLESALADLVMEGKSKRAKGNGQKLRSRASSDKVAAAVGGGRTVAQGVSPGK